jgi:hypothetical protein
MNSHARTRLSSKPGKHGTSETQGRQSGARTTTRVCCCKTARRLSHVELPKKKDCQQQTRDGWDADCWAA